MKSTLMMINLLIVYGGAFGLSWAFTEYDPPFWVIALALSMFFIAIGPISEVLCRLAWKYR